MGQVVSASITVNEKAGVLAVPIAALMDVGEGNVLNVVREGKSQRAQPELGIRDKTWIEISGTDLKEPLKAEELVIVEGGYNLPDGTAVTLKSAESDGAEAKSDENQAKRREGGAEIQCRGAGDPP